MARLPKEISQEAKKAHEEGDLERAMALYAQSAWHFKAVNLALQLGRINDALRFYRPIQGDVLPNRKEGDPFQGMKDTMYLGLIGSAGNNVGFGGLHGKVLDVGCRDGKFFGLLKRLGAEEVYGVDLDPEALSEAKQKPDASPDNVYESKVEELPQQLDGSFDYAVVFKLSLGDRESRQNAVDGIARVLKPQGRLLATFTTLQELRNYLPKINQHFTTRHASLINGSGELDSAPHRYVMHGVRK